MRARTIARHLWRSRRGATSVEYGLIVGLIALAIIGGIGTVAAQNESLWTHVSDQVVQDEE